MYLLEMMKMTVAKPDTLKDVFYGKLLKNFTDELANNHVSIERGIAESFLKVMHISLKDALDKTFKELDLNNKEL
jgi:hypothetical protein